jgi:hypothetical protein
VKRRKGRTDREEAGDGENIAGSKEVGEHRRRKG